MPLQLISENKIVLISNNHEHQIIELKKHLTGNSLDKDLVLLNRSKVNFVYSEQLKTLDLFCTENGFTIYHKLNDPTNLFLKKNRNKSKFNGYKTILKERTKFLAQPITRLDYTLSKSSKASKPFEITQSNYKTELTYMEEIRLDNLDFNLICKLLVAVDKPTLTLRKFLNKKIIVMIEVKNVTYMTIIN